MNSDDISQIGTKYAADWLQRSGYDPKQGNEQPGGVEIEADHPSARILVLLRIAVFPALPKEMTLDEAHQLKARAAQAGRRPYAATITIDAHGHLVRDAQWLPIPR